MMNQTAWVIDKAHSEVSFKIRHLMISNVKGAFKIFDANIITTGVDFSTAEIDFWIDVTSINTGDLKRDEHLLSEEFFNAKVHKQISFVSSTLGNPDQEGIHELWGELTMNGIVKNIKLNVQFGGIANDSWGNTKAGFEVTGILKRSDWDLKWNTMMETGGLMVSDDVNISCEIQLLKKGISDQTMTLQKEEEIVSFQTK